MADNSIAGWHDSIDRMTARAKVRRDEELKLLKQKTRELDPAAMTSVLVDTLLLVNVKTFVLDAGFRKQHERARDKLRAEVLRRMRLQEKKT